MTWNPLDIYARAARRLKLTPGERALLKTADTLVLAAIAGAAVAVAQAALSGGAPLSFATLWHIAIYAFATALLTGLVKLFRASGDAAFGALGGAIEGVVSRLPGAPQQPLAGSGPSASAFAARQRLDALRGGGATTQPLRAASAATSGPRTPVPPTPPSSPVAPDQDAPAPSQAQTQPSADVGPASGDDNGPPTVEMPAINAVQAAKQDAFLR